MFVLDGRPIEEGLYPAAGDTGSYFFIPVFLTAVYITYKRPIMPVCDIGKININNTSYLTLCTFSFEIKERSLSDTRCCITTLVIKEGRDVARDVLCRTTFT